uniref:Thioredoxin domain-containing protein 9 homolog n=1 Tax=Tanacetum cinerariifolium TaxID=118510 RepID=A0A6L2NWT4_TANCI|nr:thioredoxin domain-containing protein 9 homolog [Tanacetum cinerariifolium]
MANKVQEIIEQQVLTVAKAVEDKLDDEIAALEKFDLDDIEILRERRLQQMKKMAEKRTKWVALGHGEYTEIFSEKDFFTIVKASDRVVCHFYRENWPCKVVDKHLEILAKQHIETRFIKIQAEKSPFLAEKLKIVVLPTIALIKNAKVDDYVVGFNELGGTDDFSTEELEERLSRAQVIFFEGESSLKPSKQQTRNVRHGSKSQDSDSEKSAMKALKSYVKDFDIKVTPIFLEQVSEIKETRLTSACSKVVHAIARYGMDPTTPENKKRRIIRSLCKPLSDSLLSSQENLSFGAAHCLKALVDSDNWCFASSVSVNEVFKELLWLWKSGCKLTRIWDDQMAFVKGAAFEATQTAKRILMEKGSKVEKRSGQRSDSPVSQTMGSFSGNGGVKWVNVSLKDGIFLSGICTQKSVIEDCEPNRFSEDQGDYADEFQDLCKKVNQKVVREVLLVFLRNPDHI